MDDDKINFKKTLEDNFKKDLDSSQNNNCTCNFACTCNYPNKKHKKEHPDLFPEIETDMFKKFDPYKKHMG